jgi:quercetin dioxygenase-like cupin family protein
MDTKAFEAGLEADGYSEIERKRYEPRPANGEHGHHFSVRGLILDGAFVVTKEGVERTYRPGEIFEVAADTMHFEAVGPNGVELIVGRRY